MKVKLLFVSLVLALSLMPGVAQANVRPVVESFTFTPNDIDLISANTKVSFELVVSHPSGIRNTSTQVTLTGPYGSTFATNLVRIESPINLALTKVTFNGTLTIPQGTAPGAYLVSVAEIENNSTAGYTFGTGAITPNKLRDLIGAEYAMLIRSGGDLNLPYNTFVGPTHDTTIINSYNNSATYNNSNPPIWKVGEIYTPNKYYEVRVPMLPLVVTTTTPTVCSTDGKELKLIATGNCVFKVSTVKTKDYALKENIQVVTVTSARIKPEFTMSVITNQTSKNLPKIIEIFRVYSPTGTWVFPITTTPMVCIASGFYVQIVGGGTCTLTYQSEANSSYLASDLYKVSFEVTRDPQTITFTPATPVSLANKSLTLVATASSGGTVIYSSSTNEVCSVSGSTLNLLKSGSCTVTATQVGTATLAPISAVANINIVGEPIVVAKPTVMSKSISCIKGKTLKKVSGSNPKCPKGYKIKRIN